MRRNIIIGCFGRDVAGTELRALLEAEAELRRKMPEPINLASLGEDPTEPPRYEQPRLGRGSHRRWPVPK